MSNSTQHHGHKIEHFSYPLFFLTITLTLAGLCAALWLFSPTAWQLQWAASAWKFAVAFVAASFLNCFIEYFFHRYVLHQPAISGLGRMYRQHTLHHALTRIGRRPVRDGRQVLYVENKFPITEIEQGEGSFFPWYSLTAFAALYTPILALAQWYAPSFPWFIAGFAALACSLVLYEVLHAIEHWPFEKWSPRIQHPRWGRFWRTLYSFHLRHHAVIDCNESISGFFGLPLADWAFGTCLIPRTIYADGEEWKPENFIAPRPCGFIRWLDDCAARSVQARRAEQRVADAKTVVRGREFTRGEEIANWFTHGVGAAISIAALTLLIVFASARGDMWHVVSFTVFGLTLLILYTASTLFHLVSNSDRRRWIFQRLDHAAIFLLIAGTFTPFLLINLRGPWGWSLFGVVWGICGATALFKFFDAGRHNIITILGYLFAAWLAIVAIKPMLAAVPAPALWLLLSGGLCYAAGVVFYTLRNLRYQNVFRNTLVLGGSVCHVLAVLLFLTPSA